MNHHKRQPIAVLSNGISRHNFSPRFLSAIDRAHEDARRVQEEIEARFKPVAEEKAWRPSDGGGR